MQLSTKNTPKHFNPGFTLIEILVSLAIIAIAFVAILKSTALVQDSLIDTKTKNMAAMLGAKKMAQIEKSGPNNIAQWDGNFKHGSNLKWRIEDKAMSAEELKRIKLIISDSSGQKEILTFERIFFIPPEQ